MQTRVSQPIPILAAYFVASSGPTLVPSVDPHTLGWAAWRADPTNAAYLPFLQFSNRATYLAWVAHWKAQYTDLTTRIVKEKTTRGDAKEPKDTRATAQSACTSLRSEAYTFLMLRKAATAQARLQRAQSIDAQG